MLGVSDHIYRIQSSIAKSGGKQS